MSGMEHVKISYDASPVLEEVLNNSLAEFNKFSSFNDYFRKKEAQKCFGLKCCKSDGVMIAGIYCILRHDASWMFISSLWVAKQYRGCGLGLRLLKQAEDYAKNAGCQNINVETYDFQAKEFYEKQDYKVVGAIPDCPPGTICYIYVKNISNA